MRWSGSRLAALRAQLGLTADGLAEACQREGSDVSAHDVRRWECASGKGGPNGRSQAALVAALSVASSAAGLPLVLVGDLYDQRHDQEHGAGLPLAGRKGA